MFVRAEGTYAFVINDKPYLLVNPVTEIEEAMLDLTLSLKDVENKRIDVGVHILVLGVGKAEVRRGCCAEHFSDQWRLSITLLREREED